MSLKEEPLGPGFFRAKLRRIALEHSIKIVETMAEVKKAQKSTSNFSHQEELHSLYEEARKVNLRAQEDKQNFSPHEPKRRRPSLRIVR